MGRAGVIHNQAGAHKGPHTYTRQCTQTHARTHMQKNTCMHTHARTHTHMHAHARTCTHTCTHMHAHMLVHTCTHTHARTHMHAHTCTHTHARTHMHAHTCTQEPQVHTGCSRRAPALDPGRTLCPDTGRARGLPPAAGTPPATPLAPLPGRASQPRPKSSVTQPPKASGPSGTLGAGDGVPTIGSERAASSAAPSHVQTALPQVHAAAL